MAPKQYKDANGEALRAAQYPIPRYVVWRGHARRVLKLLKAHHNSAGGGLRSEHRYYIIGATDRRHVPPGVRTIALAAAWGGVGIPGWPPGSVGMLVRSDHVRPFKSPLVETGARGRPRFRGARRILRELAAA